MYKNNLVGKRYGKLVVTKFLYSKRVQHHNGFHTDTYWECLCDCGNIHKVLTRMLNSRDVKSCGCLMTGAKSKQESVFNELYNGYVCRARNKNIDFNLSKEKFREITQQKCFYCGCEPQQIARKNREYPYIYNGIDRINNFKGYTEDNIVPCCGKCNKMKLDMSVDEFKQQIVFIIKNMNWNK